jgi:hypothetical protein
MLSALAHWCIAEVGDVEPDDSTLEKLGFGSIEAMRIQLGNWEVPEWVTQEKPTAKKPQTPKPAPQKGASESKARTSGPVEKLPRTRKAMPLFRKALERLERANEELRFRKDSRQGGYYPYVTAPSKTPSDEEWDYFANLFGFGPNVRNHLYFGGGEIRYGASPRVPQSPLPELIGTYVLAGGDVGELVKALHPEDSEPNWPEITKYIEGRKVGARHQDGIKSMAARLAILIYGDTLKKGRPGPEVPGHDLSMSHRIAEGLEAGVPREQLYEELLIKFSLSEEEFPWSDFCRLADLELKFPPFPGPEEP